MTRSVAGRHRTGRLAAASAGAAAIAATILLSGCSAGQIAATAQVVSAVPGGSTRVDVPDPTDLNSAILVQNVTVAYNGPDGYVAGANAPLAMRIINQTQSPIRVTPGDATLLGSKVVVPGNGATPEPSVAGTPLGSLSWSGTTPVVTKPTASASPGGEPSSPAGAPGPPAGADVVIPAGSIAILAPATVGSTKYMQISGLSQDVKPGATVVLTLRFSVLAASGPADFNAIVSAPIAPPLVPLPRTSVSVNEGGD